jgi:hypothetical protein
MVQKGFWRFKGALVTFGLQASQRMPCAAACCYSPVVADVYFGILNV